MLPQHNCGTYILSRNGIEGVYMDWQNVDEYVYSFDAIGTVIT